ncbi:hypothetical protein BGW39_005501 [Mortierella sp. 14UC]|nr:hypothetical protein BGW39_005501 [Mortierella sp. 14UC]
MAWHTCLSTPKYQPATIPKNLSTTNCSSSSKQQNASVSNGTNCNVLRYTIDAIQRFNLDLQVVVRIWIRQEYGGVNRQAGEFYSVMAKYGWSNVIGVSVGNEILFDKYQPQEVLLSLIAEVKAKAVALGHSDIPVFMSDFESAKRPPLTDRQDKAGVNLHLKVELPDCLAN